MTQPALTPRRARASRPDAQAKVSGRAKYVADLETPGAWFGAALRSPCARGRLLGWERDPSFDWERVVLVFAADIPGENLVVQIVDDQPLLVEEEIQHVGEALALVAAPDRGTLAAALAALRPRLEELPAQLELGASCECLHEVHIEKGQVERVLAAAPRLIEGHTRTDSQEQMYIEPQGFIAWPADESGVVRVTGSLQCPHYVQAALARALGLVLEQARVVQAVTGGGFGGKEDYPSILACHAALLARAAGRPVRMIFERHEDLAVTPKRHPSSVRHRTAVDASGRLLAMDIEVVLDGGAYTTLSPVVLSRACIHAAGAYRCEHVRIHGRVLRSNHVPYGAFRGFGAPQVCFAVERQMDRIARALGKHPAEIRRLNRLGFGDRTATGQRLWTSVGAGEVLERALARTGFERHAWGARRPALAIHGESSARRVARGKGMSFFFHGTGFTGDGEQKLKGRIAVELRADGGLSVLSGSSDFGQGTQAMFQTIVCETLAAEPEQVRIEPVDTARVPNSGPTVASRTCMIVGGCLERACRELRARLDALLAPELELEPSGELPVEAGVEARVEARVEPERRSFRARALAFLAAGGDGRVEVGYRSPPGLVWDQEHYRGDAYPAYGWAADVAEVEVDLDSFEVRVTAFTTVADVGRAVQRSLVEGQLEGGSLQAIGQAHLECVTTEGGRFLQDRMATCIVPTCLDAPPMEVELVEVPFPFGPGGAKGVGELPADGGAAAVVSAIEDALGLALEHLPATPERIAAAWLEAGRGPAGGAPEPSQQGARTPAAAPSPDPREAARAAAAATRPTTASSSPVHASSQPAASACAQPLALEFVLNGRTQRVCARPMARLLDVLREELGLTGTKEGCGEGECGACTVLVNGRALNSCLVPVGQVAGASVTTIESAELDAECAAFVEQDGTQCGICTPGMILATRAWFDQCQSRGEQATAQGARVALSGNLCRCTGYGKIVASALAARPGALARAQAAGGTSAARADCERSAVRTQEPQRGAQDAGGTNATEGAEGVRDLDARARLDAPQVAGSARTAFEGLELHSPATLQEALDCLRVEPSGWCLFAGGTDLAVELGTGRRRARRILNLWGLDELRGIEARADGLRIGALTTSAELIESPAATAAADILVAAARASGAQQIQNRATIGGNLGTASPAADFAPALIALGARVRLRSAAGQRELAVEDFLCGYRQTALEPGELIESILVPPRPVGERRAFRKVGTRRAQSISKLVVALALELGPAGSARAGHIERLRVAAGSLAARTCRLPGFEAALLGRSVLEPDFRGALRAAAEASAREDVRPLDDVRSTAAYRSQTLARLLETLLLGCLQA